MFWILPDAVQANTPEGVYSCLYFLTLIFPVLCPVRYPGRGGGLPGLPPQAAALWSHQHRPHHPEGGQLRLAGGPHQRGHGERPVGHSLSQIPFSQPAIV